MKPVEFEGQTTLLAPPPGTPRGTCGALPVKVVRDKTPFGGSMLSCWKPSPEDLAALNAGAHVVLAVYGGGHPPVWLDVQKCVELP